MSRKLLALPLIVVVSALLVGCVPPTQPEPTSTAAPKPTLVPASPAPDEGLTYTVEGDAGQALSISYATVESGSYEVRQSDILALPWSTTIDGVSAEDFGPDGMSLIAQTTAEGEAIRCRISLNGTTISEETAEGPYGVAICSSLGE